MGDLKEKILTAVEEDLIAIEGALKENLTPYLDLVAEVAGHIIFSGGKRLRPLLMVLCARICGYQGHYDKTFSSAIEYLHAATLLHDDLVDDAKLRRGKPVAHLKWGNATTVLVGDFLLARAMSISAGTEKLKIIQLLAELTENMSQGEVHQLMSKGNVELTEAEYLEVIQRKTAMLFEAACRTSAVLADAAAEKETALAQYGYHLGIAFQMADDLLDYTTDSAVLGKEVGADLKEGKLTLPVIHALREADSADRRKMVEIITDDHFDPSDFEYLVGLLDRYGGISYTRKTAAKHIVTAKAVLSAFEASRTRDTLVDIADYALSRQM
jgi:octaprenyl-diphosphate synthase